MSKPKVQSVGGEVVVDRLRDADDGRVLLLMERARTPSMSSPPSRRARRVPPRGSGSRTRSTPSSSLNGFVREVPRIVPPRGRSPEISRGPSGSKTPSTSPRQPERTPTTNRARAENERRATARITAFNPGTIASTGKHFNPHTQSLPRHLIRASGATHLEIPEKVRSTFSGSMPKVGLEPTRGVNPTGVRVRRVYHLATSAQRPWYPACTELKASAIASILARSRAGLAGRHRRSANQDPSTEEEAACGNTGCFACLPSP